MHSFVCRPREDGDVVGAGEYGERFASIVERDNVAGVQFHPEKSSRDGLALLRELRGRGVILYPAIDILDGKAVRLVEGRFEDQTVYHDDPLSAAQSWVEAGARFLHVVDLDGARSGAPQSSTTCAGSPRETGVPVQYGGGLRSLAAVREALRAGAERVIVGTAAFRDIDFLDAVVAAFGPRVLVSVDVRGGHIRPRAGAQTTQMPAGDAIRRLGDRGVSSFVYTDVDRDGKLEGPDLDDVRHVAESVRGRFLYSGGIGDLDHLRALADLRQVNLAGVIVGKALYEGSSRSPRARRRSTRSARPRATAGPAPAAARRAVGYPIASAGRGGIRSPRARARAHGRAGAHGCGHRHPGARGGPALVRGSSALALQRTAGNAATARLLSRTAQPAGAEHGERAGRPGAQLAAPHRPCLRARRRRGRERGQRRRRRPGRARGLLLPLAGDGHGPDQSVADPPADPRAGRHAGRRHADLRGRPLRGPRDRQPLEADPARQRPLRLHRQWRARATPSRATWPPAAARSGRCCSRRRGRACAAATTRRTSAS